MGSVVEEKKVQGTKAPIYRKAGYVLNELGVVVGLIIGVGIATMVLIFVSVLGAQTYAMMEPEIQAINNTDIQTHITDAITNSFKALSQTGKYMPLIVLAVVISIVIALVVNMGRGGATYYYYGAL